MEWKSEKKLREMVRKSSPAPKILLTNVQLRWWSIKDSVEN